MSTHMEIVEAEIQEACVRLDGLLFPFMLAKIVQPDPGTWSGLMKDLRTVLDFAKQQSGPVERGGNHAWNLVAEKQPFPCETVLGLNNNIEVGWANPIIFCHFYEGEWYDEFGPIAHAPEYWCEIPEEPLEPDDEEVRK